jgi:Putative zinc-finger
MNQTTQSGNHPDAESLNAFAEQALTPTEREQVLAHLATCGRCRQVVYLAQQTAGVESRATEPAASSQQPVSLSPPSRPQFNWLAGWRLAWIPVGVLAGIVGIAVLQHARHTQPEPQLADNARREQLQRRVAPSQSKDKDASTTDRPRFEAKKVDSLRPRLDAPPVEAKPSPKSAGSPTRTTLSTPPTLQVRSAEVSRPEAAVAGLLKSERDVAQETGSGSGSNVVARLKGPRAPEQQQQQLAYQQPQTARLAAAGNSKTTPVDSVAVAKDAAKQANSSPAANAPAPIAPLAIEPFARNENKVTSSTNLASLEDWKAKSTVLPNGMAALSVTTAQGRTIAIAPSGEVYLTEDSGRRWVLVVRQWTGRAVLVRAVQSSATNSTGSSLHGEAAGGPRAAVYELVNDNLQTWVSSDGRTWLPQALPLK